METHIKGSNLVWKETTNPKDPLTREGEITCYQHWLEGYDKEEPAKFTIRLTRDVYSTTWWHGNRGYFLGEFNTIQEADRVCENKLKEMVNKIEI